MYTVILKVGLFLHSVIPDGSTDVQWQRRKSRKRGLLVKITRAPLAVRPLLLSCRKKYVSLLLLIPKNE